MLFGFRGFMQGYTGDSLVPHSVSRPVLVKEVIVLRGDGDEVDGADVEAEKHPVVDVVRHRKASLVVAEVAAI